MADHVTIRFGPLQSTVRWSFPFGLGVLPSTCQVQTPPHLQSLPSVETLEILVNGTPFITFPDCRVGTISLSMQRMRIWTIPIQDRRWKWQYGVVSGHWNIRKPDGTIVRETTPWELAELFAAQMGDGETGIDPSALPEDARPEIRLDRSNAAQALLSLCSSLGCVVGLNPADDTLGIWRIGESSAPLPPNPRMSGGLTLSLSEPVGKIRVWGGETLFQGEFRCEPVGLQPDGSIEKIDDLDYAPPVTISPLPGDLFLDGWETEWPPFYNVVEKITSNETYEQDDQTLRYQDLAQSCIWKYWRITGLVVPEGQPVTWSPTLLKDEDDEPMSLEDIELLTTLVQEDDLPDGTKQRRAAMAWTNGVGLKTKQPFEFTSGDEFLKIYVGSFSVDARRGLIIFQEPIYREKERSGPDAEGKTRHVHTIQRARVRVRLGYKVRTKGIYHRHSKTFDRLPNDLTADVTEQSAVRQVIEHFSKSGGIITTDDNVADVDNQLDYRAGVEDSKMIAESGEGATYPGILQFSPDGVTQQVVWSGGKGPSTTTISQGYQANPYAPTYEEHERAAVETEVEEAMTGHRSRVPSDETR